VGAELGFVEVEADFDSYKKVTSGTVERALRREFGVFAFLVTEDDNPCTAKTPICYCT
jgi:hypothetical protein